MSWIGGLCPRCGVPGTLRPGTSYFRCKPCKAKAERESKRRKRVERRQAREGEINSYRRNRRKEASLTLEWMLSHRGERNDQGCWLWLGLCNLGGYGIISVEGKKRTTHIVACELVGRFAPPNFEGDHTCRVRNCFNPDHIEYVTKKVNTQRGKVVKFIGGLCPRCSEPGTLRVDGAHRCGPCNVRRARERRQRKRDGSRSAG